METAGPNPSYLNLNGHTLTNAGAVDVSAGNAYAYIYDNGAIDNTGTVTVEGTLQGNSANFTNATGGSISVANGGSFGSVGTFTQDGGTNTGVPIAPSTLVLAGGGAASFSARRG